MNGSHTGPVLASQLHKLMQEVVDHHIARNVDLFGRLSFPQSLSDSKIKSAILVSCSLFWRFDLSFDRLTEFQKRFKKERRRIDFVIDSIDGLALFDNSQVEQILELALGGLQAKTCFIHDLPLIKGSAGLGDQ